MKKFTKSDLREGDIVMYKNGQIRFVKQDLLLDEERFNSNGLIFYDEELRHNSNETLNIVEVFRSIWKREEPTITSIERVLLENVEKKYKYIARDHDLALFIFGESPTKENMMWFRKPDSYVASFTVYGHLFPMVKWEDKEPWLIEDLLKLQTKEDK